MDIIKQQLIQLADEEYQKFQSKLCPGINNILGVRIPKLRKLAKQIVKEDFRDYIKEAKDDYYDETMLQGIVLGYAKADIDEIIKYISIFVPKINNWAVCDVFCNGLKITNDYKEKMWNFILPYIDSTSEFKVRFAVVMLLEYYIQKEYIDKIFKRLDSIKHEGYYVKMAVAWTVSICYIKFPKQTLNYLKNNELDDFTYNKSLQKIVESTRTCNETKTLMRSMKRK
ncbi:DNA alkylation repair protein [Clostridiaceae bacterium M8S5]|nr:DNA alkylation repair protein [Clostridiaceae bacterium M8S5]